MLQSSWNRHVVHRSPFLFTCLQTYIVSINFSFPTCSLFFVDLCFFFSQFPSYLIRQSVNHRRCNYSRYPSALLENIYCLSHILYSLFLVYRRMDVSWLSSYHLHVSLSLFVSVIYPYPHLISLSLHLSRLPFQTNQSPHLLSDTAKGVSFERSVLRSVLLGLGLVKH